MCHYLTLLRGVFITLGDKWILYLSMGGRRRVLSVYRMEPYKIFSLEPKGQHANNKTKKSTEMQIMFQFSTTSLLLLLLSLQNHIHIRTADGFSPTSTSRSSAQSFSFFIPRHSLLHLRPLGSEVQTSSLEGSLSGSILHEYVLNNHKPLGCSVEESLAKDDDGAKYVFVAEVNNGGNAEKVGIRVGDVIVQISGTFDEIVDVAGLGIERVRSLVGGRSEERPLVICIARGSDVKQLFIMLYYA
jgi:hypothetical protein